MTQTFIVTVVSNYGNNIYQIDGVNYPILSLVRGGVYTFDQSNATNTNHPIAFKNGAGSSYTTGVVSTGTPGQNGAQTVFTVSNDAPNDLRYYCTVHGNGMGNTITVSGGPPTINSFTATPASIVSGNASTLAWSTTNVTSVTINNGVGTFGPNTSTSVSPNTTTTYTLTATGPEGTTTSTVTVTVTQPAPSPYIGSSFGLLGAIIPQINKNEILYQSPVNTLTIGKVSISSKNYNPVKIRLGISTDDVNLKYLEYNKFINHGESFETENIHVGNGQKLFIRSTNSDVNFIFHGETFDETLNPVKSGLLNSVSSIDNQKKLIYQVPSNAQGILSISICNLGSQICKARIGISSLSLDSFDSSKYAEYNVEIGPTQTYTRTDLKLKQNQSLICSSDDESSVSFVCHGRLIYDINKLVVTGDTILDGNLGIGTTANGYRLRVGGNIFIDGPITVSGITTLNSYVDINNSVDILNNLNVVGVSTLGGYVDINASVDILNNLNVTGVSTFIGVIDINGGAYIDNIQIGITNDNEIDTTSGNLTIDSAGGTTTIDDKLVVTGITTFNSTTTFEQFIFGQISVSLLSS